MRPPRALLIEDDAPLIRLLAWLFEDGGFEVAAVATPEEALERFGGHLPLVVVFNTGKPPVEKDAVMREWRRLAPGTRFIDISERDAPWRDQYYRTSADAHFVMPFDSDELIEAARSLQF
jgi:CheY-like chemotaxis protein